MDGGCWKIKWNPINNYLLLAGMQSGFHIIDSTGNKMCTFDHDATLAYGIDWCYSPDSSLCVCTASFYDRSICLW